MRYLALAASTLLLAACSGGSSSGHVSDPPSVYLTSPAEGARIVTGGSHTIDVVGAFTGDKLDVVTLSVNGGTPVPVTPVNGSFHAQLVLANGANTIEAKVTSPHGDATSDVEVFFPFISLQSFQEATLALGQEYFVDSQANRGDLPGADTISNPFGDAGWDGARLYLPDYGNHRVLVYDALPTEMGASADLVLGQPDFTTVDGGGGPSATSWDATQTVQAVNGKLVVAEYGNHRILILNALPTASGAAADLVLGAPDLTSDGPGCTAAGLEDPESFFVVDGKVVVADAGHNRILIWNTFPTSSGQPADLVLGQADFTSCDANRGGTTSATGLSYPSDVWSDGTRLYVADPGNNRVLGWSTFPTTSDAAPDLVLGQADFTSSEGTTGRGGMDYPYFLRSNGNQLFVADADNNRVLVWNALPTAGGALPDAVLGQSDFDHNTADDDDQDGNPEAFPTARTLSYPAGVAAFDDFLVVTDNTNNRFLIFK